MRFSTKFALTLTAAGLFVAGLMAVGLANVNERVSREMGNVFSVVLKSKTARLLPATAPVQSSLTFKERYDPVQWPAAYYNVLPMPAPTFAISPPLPAAYVAPTPARVKAPGCSSLHPYTDAPGPC